MFEPHYDRHVWLYRENPNGVFTPFNPAVTCAIPGTRSVKHLLDNIGAAAGAMPDAAMRKRMAAVFESA